MVLALPLSPTLLVTGGSQRIGAAICQNFAKKGWKIAIHYHSSQEKAEILAQDCRNLGTEALTFSANLADPVQAVTLIHKASQELGPLCCLVNNAAHFINDNLENLTIESWQAHFAVNTEAPLLLSQAFYRQLPEGIKGNIINILDYAIFNLPDRFLSYTVSKASLWTLTQMLARGLAPFIRVNAIAPGPTLKHPRQSEERFAESYLQAPLERPTNPEEICQAIDFLLHSPSMTGQCLILDGGKHLMHAPYI